MKYKHACNSCNRQIIDQRRSFVCGFRLLKTIDALGQRNSCRQKRASNLILAKKQVTLNGLLFFKVALGCAAYRTLPIIRYILPFGPGSHAIIRITLFGVIDIPTDRTYVPVHSFSSFSGLNCCRASWCHTAAGLCQFNLMPKFFYMVQ